MPVNKADLDLNDVTTETLWKMQFKGILHILEELYCRNA